MPEPEWAGGRVYLKRLAALESNAVKFNISEFAVFTKPRVIYNHRFRLIFSYSCVKPFFLPVRIPLIPHSVEPKPAYLAVVFRERFHAFTR